MEIYLNSEHPIKADIAQATSRILEAREMEILRQNRILSIARPQEEERTVKNGILTEIGKSLKIDLNKYGDAIHEKNKRFAAQITDKIKERPVDLGLTFHEDNTPLTVPPDSSFWWAATYWRNPGDFKAGMDKEGLGFSGFAIKHDGDLRIDSFGATAVFELQPERMPVSPSGRWRSTPHVELFGGLLGHAGDNDIFTGDLWSKCWMHRRQTILKWGLGSVPNILGERVESQTLIFEENSGRTVSFNMPGFQWMPVVDFSNVWPAQSLWAHLEVRFDFQIEGAGSLISIDPRLLLRTFQWAPIPI